MKRILRWSMIVVFAGCALPLAKAQFAKDDEVELVRDEPLLFNGTVYRQGRKGEVFPVAAYRADAHKVFLMGKDSAGKPFALSVPDSALALVRKDVTLLADQAFALLRTARLEEAQRGLLQVAALDPSQRVCAEVALHAGMLAAAIQTYEKTIKQQQDQRPELERRIRNAAVADRPNPLSPGDNSNQLRAEEMRRSVRAIEQEMAEAVAGSRERIATELNLLDEIAQKQVAAGAFSTALSLHQMLLTVAARKLGQREFSPGLGGSDRQELQTRVAHAQARLAEARRAVDGKRLNAARLSLLEGLKDEPGSASLRQLLTAVERRLDECGKAYAVAATRQTLKQYEKALESVEKLREDCSDHEPSEALAASLKRIIAEKAERLAKARTSEAAGDFAPALEAYDTYALEEDARRILPLYGKQAESAGNFLLAYEQYFRAGLSAEVQRIQRMKDEQIVQYDTARIFLADGKFADALAIYRRYKDTAQERDALRRQGALCESQEKFDDALEIYRQAQLAEEVTRVKSFLAERAGLLADAAHQEQAANQDRALELFQKANAKSDVQRVAGKMAKESEAKKDYESAIAYFEIAGLYDEAGRIRRSYDLSKTASLRKLSDPEIFKRCGPGCVTIVSANGDGVGLGSGFFVGKGGYILTNNHVIDGASRIKVVTSTQKVLDAELVAVSRVPDLALLKADIKDNPVLKLGDPTKVETGAHVAAIGSPKGLPQSFTAGSISNTERDYDGNACFQISVLINHGNSGGPLLDEMGQVIGLNTFGEGTATVLRSGQGIGSDIQGINYAIKISEARKLLQKVPGL